MLSAIGALRAASIAALRTAAQAIAGYIILSRLYDDFHMRLLIYLLCEQSVQLLLHCLLQKQYPCPLAP